MTNSRVWLVVVATTALAACGRDASPTVDEALRRDLSLASSVGAYPSQQYVSPEEQGLSAGHAPQPRYAPQPYYQPRPQQVVYRQAPRARVVRRAPAAPSGGQVYGDDGAHGGAEPVVKNTRRDAIIGAAAGAAIGVASSRNTLKGAIIGAAAGGLLGAVVGEKIDVRRPR